MRARLKKRLLLRLVVLVSCATLFSQSAVHESAQEMFRVSGTITRFGTAVGGNWVSFEGASNKSVRADAAGRYEANLPLGVWKVAVTASPGVIEKGSNLSRPRLFRVTRSTDVTLDLFVRPPVGCGGVRIITPDGSPPSAESVERKNESCAGQQFFSVPSSDGVPFEVIVGGLNHGLCLLKGLNGAACDRQFATYNLFSVQADKVVYHPRDWTLEATGNVVVRDGNGDYRRDSAKFFIGDGRAVPVY